MKKVWEFACVRMYMKHAKNEKEEINRNWGKMKLFEKENADRCRKKWMNTRTVEDIQREEQ